MLHHPTSLQPSADEGQQDSRNQKPRRNNVGEDAEVGILVPLGEVHPDQQREGEQRPHRRARRRSH
jgi:hypothetical protein